MNPPQIWRESEDMTFQNPLKPSVSLKLFHQLELLSVNAHFKTFRGHKLHSVKAFHQKHIWNVLSVLSDFCLFSILHYQGKPCSAAICSIGHTHSIWLNLEADLLSGSLHNFNLVHLWDRWLHSQKLSLLVTMSPFYEEISDDCVYLWSLI